MIAVHGSRRMVSTRTGDRVRARALGRRRQLVLLLAAGLVVEDLGLVATLEDLPAQGVDRLALVVHHVVVLEQVLPRVEVHRLDLGLGVLDRLVDHRRLDRHVLFHAQALHQAGDAVGAEDPHQVVFEAQEEARGARVALATGAAAQLVVDAAALVPLGAEDEEAAELEHLLPLLFALLLEPRVQLGEFLGLLVGIEVGLGHHLGVAAEDDVGAAARHVGRDRDRVLATGLGDDEGLALVVLGVEDRVRDVGAIEQLVDDLRLLDARGADQDRLAALVALADLLDDRLELAALVLVDDVVLVLAGQRPMRRHDDDLEVVDLVELLGFGVGRAGHAGQLLVHAEVVLIGDRGQGLRLGLDRHVLLGLDRLVETVAPAPAFHLAAGELVDDHDLAVLDQVVDVALVEHVRAQALVRRGACSSVFSARVEVAAAEQLLDAVDARVGQLHR